MTNQDNKIEKKQKEKKSQFLKLFLLITLLGIFGAYLILQASPTLLEYIYPNKTVNTIPGDVDDGYSVGPEPPLYPTENKEVNDKINDIKENITQDIEVFIEPEEVVEEVVNPYIEIIDVEAKAFDNSAIKAKFNEYRIFISNANKLIEKYKANQNFTTELNIFKDPIHPTHINEIIKLLESYNTLLEKRTNYGDESQVKTEPCLKKLFTKFVKIKKIEPDDEELLKVKANIDERLDIFTDYIYSQKLQDNLVK